MLGLRPLVLVLVWEEKQVELDELELKREGEVDETDSSTFINSGLCPSFASNDSNLDLTTLRFALTTCQVLDQRELGLAAKQEWIEGGLRGCKGS